jgi:hypothetical protein
MSYTPTLQSVKYAFDEINKEVFDEGLDHPEEFYIDALDTEWGFCTREDGQGIVLGLTNEFPSRAEFYDTLAHEMTHLFQYQILGIEPNHGKTFKVWINPMKKKDYLI